MQADTLGRAGLWIGIAAATLVFGIIVCANVGVAQGWIQAVSTPLFICGTTTAFLGLVGALVSLGGLLSKAERRAPAIIGLILGLLALCMFIGALARLGGG
jgi:hypothetical protein